MDIQNIIEQLKTAKIPDDFIDYVFENSTLLIPEATHFNDYEKLLNIMFDNGLKIDDKFMINVYKSAILNDKLAWCFDFFRSESFNFSVDKILDVLIKSEITKFDAIITIMYFIDDFKTTEYYLDILLKDFETDFFDYYSQTISKSITEILLKKNYNKYIEIVKNNLKNQTTYYFNASYILNLTKDDDFIKDYFIAKIIDFTKTKGNSSTFSDIERCLINYLKTGVFEKDFDVVINKFLKGFGKYDKVFYTYFLEGFNIDLSKQFHRNLFNLSIKLDLKETLTDIVKLYYEKKPENIENLEKVIKSNIITKATLFRFLIETQSESSFYKSIEEQIIYMIKNYYDDCLEGVKNASNEGIITGLKYIFEANKEKSFYFVLSFAENKSKLVNNGVIELLYGYKMLEEYKKLLNSKKAQVREIGEKLIASLKNNSETTL